MTAGGKMYDYLCRYHGDAAGKRMDVIQAPKRKDIFGKYTHADQKSRADYNGYY